MRRLKYVTVLLFFFVHSATSANYFQLFNVTEIPKNVNDSKCRDAFVYMLENNEAWSILKMFDASARIIPSGLLEGNPFDLGNFDECISVEVAGGDVEFRGKHCLGILPLNLQASQQPKLLGLNSNHRSWKHTHGLRQINGAPETGIHLAVCVPSVCTPEDLNEWFQGTLVFSDVLCRSKDDEEEFGASAITTVVFLSIIICVAVVQTAYDTYLHYNELKPRHEILIAFSVLTNGRKLLSSAKNSDQLTCINGIRALSMVWVVLGHEYSIFVTKFIQNYTYLNEWALKKENMYLMGATVSVDTFFALAGMVTVYSFLRSQEKGVKFNVIMYYVHRYLRLTPALAVMALIDATLLIYLVNGPLFNLIVKEQTVEGCRQYWWQSLLYIHNYTTTNVKCLDVTWYLAVDTQLFFLSPLVLYPLKKWPKLTVYGIFGLIVAGILSPFLITYLKNLPTGLMDENVAEMMRVYYIKTHARFGPYVIGMLFGYYIYHLKKGTYRIKIPKIYAVPYWILLTAGLVSCVYAGYDTMQGGTRLQNAFYYGFNRNAWALGVCLTVVACVTGYGGPINTFLSAPIFQFISKISYSIYLIHYVEINLRAGGSKTTHIFTDFNVIFDFWGDFMISSAFAIVLCLLFESPIIIIEKTLFGRFTKPKAKSAPTKELPA